MKLSDLKGLFQTADIPLIRSRRIRGNQYVFDFGIEGLQPWRPGEHGAFYFKGKHVSGKPYRGFSIASIPEEGVLKIATRIGDDPSSFKAHLRAMIPGDVIRIRGPFGWFTLRDQHSPVVLIAGGIGIAPLRALLKTMEKDNKRMVTLIYSAGNDHLFKEELQAIGNKDPKIKLWFLHSRDELLKIVNKSITAYGPSAYYYLSGTPAMLKDLIRHLKSKGIPRKKIITDPFFGY